MATRDWRHAQTCGLTYCTVLMPARFSAAAAGLLKSCASMPMNASTPPRSMRAMSSRRNARMRAQVRQHLEEAHDGDLFGAIPRLAAGRDHLRPGHADELGVGDLRAQRLDEPRPERIARRLSRHQRKPQRSRSRAALRHRARPREPSRSESRNGLISGCASTSGASSAIASSSFSDCRYTTRYASRMLRICSAVKPRRFKPFGVDAARLGRPSRDRDVRRHVLRHVAEHARQRVRADAAKLVHGREAAEDRVVADAHVAGDRRVVREDRVVADDAVVRDVAVRHDPVVVADRRDALVLDRAAIERAVLADRVAVADDEPRPLAGVLLVLRIVADRGELEDVVVGADDGRALDDDVRLDARAARDLDVGADDGVGADVDVASIFAAGSTTARASIKTWARPP